MKTFVTLHFGIEQFFVFLLAKFNNKQQQQKVHVLYLSLTSTKKEIPLVNMYINNIFEDRFQQVVIESILKNLNFFVTHLLRRPSSRPLPKYSLCCPPQTWAWTTTTRTSRSVEARSSPLSLSALLLSAHLAPRALSWPSHSRRCRMLAGMFPSLGVLRLACPPLQTCLQEDQAPWGLAL